MSKTKKIAIYISSVIALLAVAITVILLCTDVLTHIKDIFDSDFRVMYQTKKFTGTDNAVTLPNTGEAVFTVKGCDIFTYSVTANADFDYTFDGNAYAYSQTDIGSILLSEGRVENGSIVFDCTKNNSLYGVLSRLHNSKDIIVPDPKLEYPFLLTVNSGESEIRIAFGFERLYGDISVNPDSVVF